MDVTAYDLVSRKPLLLGAVAEQIWVKGFQSSSERGLQIVRAFRAPVPDIYDRVTTTEDFSFAAGRSFGADADAVGHALEFLATHPKSVPRKANLRFVSGGSGIWLLNCGITNVRLVEKNGAYIAFSYHVAGGTWALKAS